MRCHPIGAHLQVSIIYLKTVLILRCGLWVRGKTPMMEKRTWLPIALTAYSKTRLTTPSHLIVMVIWGRGGGESHETHWTVVCQSLYPKKIEINLFFSFYDLWRNYSNMILFTLLSQGWGWTSSVICWILSTYNANGTHPPSLDQIRKRNVC